MLGGSRRPTLPVGDCFAMLRPCSHAGAYAPSSSSSA